MMWSALISQAAGTNSLAVKSVSLDRLMNSSMLITLKTPRIGTMASTLVPTVCLDSSGLALKASKEDVRPVSAPLANALNVIEPERNA